MKPQTLPKFRVGDQIKLGNVYMFKVFQITYRGAWRYSGNMYKNGRLMNGASISEYDLMKIDPKDVKPPGGTIYKLNVVPATGRALDQLGAFHGLKRKTYFWIFKERDNTFRSRIKASILGNGYDR